MRIWSAVLVAGLAGTAHAEPCGRDGTLYPFAEEHEELSGNPVFGAFFREGYLFGDRWSSDAPLPTTRIAIAVPPPFSGEVTLRHRPKPGWWCSGELRVEHYEGRLDLARIALPVTVEWRVARGGRVLKSGRMNATELFFSRDEIVVSDAANRSERFPIDVAVYAEPTSEAIERQDVGLPEYGLFELFARSTGITTEHLLAGPAPWPKVALNLAIDRLVEAEREGGLSQARAREEPALKEIAARKKEPASVATATRWLRRMSVFDDTLGTATAEARIDPGVSRLFVNGRAVIDRPKKTKAPPAVVTRSLPVPRSGLAVVEVGRDVFVANGGYTMTERKSAWIPLIEGQAFDVDFFVQVQPPVSAGQGCVVVRSTGFSGTTWMLSVGGKTGPHPLDTPVPFVDSEALIDFRADYRAAARIRPAAYRPLLGGTAIFTVDADGAVSGAFDVVDRCRTPRQGG